MIRIPTTLVNRLKHDFLPFAQEPMHKELNMVFSEPAITIGNTQRKSDTFSLDECLCDGENLRFGDCQTSIMKFTCADVTEDIEGKEFVCSITMDNTSISLGTFIVHSAKKENDLRYKEVTAYDRMIKFSIDVAEWWNGLTFPITVKSLRDQLCTLIGVEQNDIVLPNDSMTVNKVTLEKLVGIDLLKAICEINGCFGHMDRYGKLKYIFLHHTYGQSMDEDLALSEDLELHDDYWNYDFISISAGDDLPPETSNTIKFEEFVVPAIDKLCIAGEDGGTGTYEGVGDNCYTITGNFLLTGKSSEELHEILKNIYPLIADRPYRPLTAEMYGLPFMEVGDAIVPEHDGKYVSYCLHRTLTGVQVLRDSIECKGNKEKTEDLSTNVEIRQLQQKTMKIVKEVDEVSAELTDFESDTASNFTMHSNEIALRVSKGDVSNQLSIEEDGIDLSGNRLTINSTNFTLTADGTLTTYNMNAVNATLTGTLEAPTINGGSINGSKLTVSGGMGTTVIDTDGEISHAWQNIAFAMAYGSLSLTDGDTTTQMLPYAMYVNGCQVIHEGNISEYVTPGVSESTVAAICTSVMASHVANYHSSNNKERSMQ